MLDARNISKSYSVGEGALSVLRGVSLALQAGESLAIMGPSGCGKSTLLNILGTLDTPSGGTLRIGEVDPFALSEPELARFRNQRIGFIFQDHHLLPQCSVLENVLIPTLIEAGSDALDHARELLNRVGLSARLDHLPSELSGGERQRVAIARALVTRPTVLLADEPTGNLDRHTAETVAALLVEMHRSARTILVVVTHSEALAAQFDRIHELSDGKIQGDAPP